MDDGRRTFLSGFAAFGAAGLVSLHASDAWGQAPPVVQQGGARPDEDLPFHLKIAAGAEARAAKAEVYDPSYVRLAYPMGDVDDGRGVCADTVVRAFRHAGVDLQVKVHEDMARNFASYPKIWGLTRPDRNIDHRRVPNLETFFARRGGSRRISATAADYRAGDVVSWRLTGSGLPHIGIVSRRVQDGEPMIAHNIGAGTQIERVLFAWPIRGWYRFDRWA